MPTPAHPADPTLTSWEADAETEDTVLRVEHFEKDVICVCCGNWRSEHRFDLCQNPQWLGDKD